MISTIQISLKLLKILNLLIDYLLKKEDKTLSILQLEEAIELLLENTAEMNREERIDLLSSFHRVLSQDIYAPMENPPFDRSPLDGYSFHNSLSQGASEETPRFIPIIDIIDAGREFITLPEVGVGVGIMTGAMIPEGCNCVIRQEDIELTTQLFQGKLFQGILVKQELKPFENFVHKGEDISLGTLLMKRGEKITHHHMGVLATMGMAEVPVKSLMKVGILSTGDELLPIGASLTPGKIFNSNLYMLTARMRSLGIDVRMVTVCKDNPFEVERAISQNFSDLDLFITTGGVSVGRKDIFHEVVKLPGAEKLFWKVKIQPGTPVLAWKKNSKLVISLSGNPFAALTNFELLVRPVLAKISGDTSLSYKSTLAVVQGEFPKKSSNRRFIRGRYEDGIVFIERRGHSSGELLSTLNSNCLIDIPPGKEGLSSGERVKVVLL